MKNNTKIINLLLVLFFLLGLAKPIPAMGADPVVITRLNHPAIFDLYSQNRSQKIIKTVDGTLHVILNLNGSTQTCNGSSVAGLVWFTSSDNGASWNCVSELSASSGLYPAAATDSSNNIYLVYSEWGDNTITTGNIYYRKLSKSGSTWSSTDSRTVLSAAGNTKYHFATINLENTDRIWLSTRVWDGISTKIAIYYSDGMGDDPTWALSTDSLFTRTGLLLDVPAPEIIRFGSKIGVFYLDNYYGNLKWRHRSNTDPLNSWQAETTIVNSGYSPGDFDVIGNSNGKIYLSTVYIGNGPIYFLHYDGASWSSPVRIINSGGGYNSLFLDGTDVFVLYTDDSSVLPTTNDHGLMYYRKIAPPFTSIGNVSPAKLIVNHVFFNKVFKDIGGVFTDLTLAASNVGYMDVVLNKAVGNILYVGSTTPFDSVSWDVDGNSSRSGGIVWEYFNGITWSTLPFVNSQKADFGGGNPSRGWFIFTPPQDWSPTEINSSNNYYLRARITSVFSSDIPLNQIIPAPLVDNLMVLESFTSDNKMGVIYTDTEERSSFTNLARLKYIPIDTSTYNLPEPDTPWEPFFSSSFDSDNFPPEGFTTGGDVPWVSAPTVLVDGTASAKSGTISGDQTSYLRTNVTITEDSILKFYWAVSSEEDYDYLNFCINNDECTADAGYEYQISGFVGMSPMSINLSPGNYSLTWKYIKDSSNSEGEDRGFVGKITVKTVTQPPTPEPTPTGTIPDEPEPTPTITQPDYPSPTNTPIGEVSPVPNLLPSAPSCNDQKPGFNPDLFQINTTNNTARLFFTPLSDTNNYYISYSTKPNAEEHGVSVLLAHEGVQNFTVRLLKLNTIYYFKVRGQNGCMPGDWSNILKIKTDHKIYYKNSIVKTDFAKSVKSTPKPFPSISNHSPSPAPIPSSSLSKEIKSNSAPSSKKCFLWWCW